MAPHSSPSAALDNEASFIMEGEGEEEAHAVAEWTVHSETTLFRATNLNISPAASSRTARTAGRRGRTSGERRRRVRPPLPLPCSDNPHCKSGDLDEEEEDRHRRRR